MKSFITGLSLFLTITVFGQTEKEITKIADGTCECLKEKDIDPGDMDQVEIDLGLCMLSAMSSAGIDSDISSTNEVEKLGERVGMKLAMSCPEFMDLIGGLVEENPDELNRYLEEDETILVFGEVIEVNTGEFVTVKIENEDGRKQTFYWFYHFEGADLLTDGGKQILGKQVSIVFSEMEYYNGKLEDYTYLKVLESIEIE